MKAIVQLVWGRSIRALKSVFFAVCVDHSYLLFPSLSASIPSTFSHLSNLLSISHSDSQSVSHSHSDYLSNNYILRSAMSPGYESSSPIFPSSIYSLPEGSGPCCLLPVTVTALQGMKECCKKSRVH